jgi:hypothetical protein
MNRQSCHMITGMAIPMPPYSASFIRMPKPSRGSTWSSRPSVSELRSLAICS